MNRIGQTIIAAYMAHVHEFIKEKDELDVFAIVDPGDTYQCERPDFIPVIVNRLKQGKRDHTFLIPCNSGEHWILTTICKDGIFILDSLPQKRSYKSWEESIMTAVNKFNVETGRFNRVPKLKYLSGVPKQPGGIEYGYYVMRYMKDIITHHFHGSRRYFFVYSLVLVDEQVTKIV